MTAKGRQLDHIDVNAIKRYVQEELKQRKAPAEPLDLVEPTTELSWHDELLSVLLKMEPKAFERSYQQIERT